MANQKHVDEIRIGRVKATIWRNGTDEQPRHNVTFSRLYKDGDQWKLCRARHNFHYAACQVMPSGQGERMLRGCFKGFCSA